MDTPNTKDISSDEKVPTGRPGKEVITKEELEVIAKEVALLKEINALSHPVANDNSHEDAFSKREKIADEHWRAVERKNKLKELRELREGKVNGGSEKRGEGGAAVV